MDTQFDRFKLPEDDDFPVATCAECGGEIYVDDEVRRTHDGEYVHGNLDCVEDYAYKRVYDASGTIDKRGGIV